ncbi:ankyrin repeat domain-containing protein 30A-like isoform X3 [Tyto alba]|uniref:ankyrin repeat domain-containing protein 30A-like isoform X3 n=1 Tax=Tyto alba TaxID=56313 RepID=UPI001C681392|nr:ankyrin repeat domain-containing protein 30A-like isoform X3 [Tyto alba]
MQRLIGLLRRLRGRPPPGSAPAPRAAEPREQRRGGLHCAAASGDLARLQRRWWRKWFRINERDAEKQTPLHLACANGHAAVVRFLAGKKCKLNPCDSFQKSPLMKAVERQHKDCVAILLEHGASPDLKGPGGNTALHLAAVIPNKSLVELLLAHKAHIDAQNELGYTPLTLAITEHCEEMVEFLLQKGADVHARDNRKRTTLMLAACAGDMNIIQILLHHGADLSHQDPFGCTAEYYAREFQHDDIADQLEKYMFYEGMGECFARGTEGPAVDGRFCSALTAEFTSGAPAGVLPAAGAEEEKDVDSWSDFELDSEDLKKESAGILLPPADEHRAHGHSGAEERGNGVLPAAGAEEEKDVDSWSDFELDSEDLKKESAGILLPPADEHRAHVHSGAEERGNGVLPAAGAEEEKDVDSWSDFELDSEDLKKESAGILLPPADEHRAHAHSGAEERGNGVLPAAGAEEEKDVDSWSDFELDSEDLKKESAGILLPPADEHRAHVHSGAEERGNGVLPAAGAEEEKDVDSWSDFELDSEDLKKESAGILLPPADEHRAHAHSGAEERGNGVLPAAGAEEEKDVDSWSDFELDSEDLKKESAGILLPPADEHRAHVHSGAEERGNGVLPAAGAEEEKDVDSWSDFELDSEDLKKESAGILLPPADEHRAHVHSGAEERGNGVLPAAGAEEEKDVDSWSDFELDSEDLKKESAGILLPPADEHRAHAHSGAEERGNGVLPAAGAEEEKDVDSWSDFELDSEDLKKESAGILLPPADEHRAHAHSGAEERGNGVLPAAGAEEEKDEDSWSDFELDSEDLKKESAGILLPPADEHRAHAHSGAEERGNGVLPVGRAEQEEGFDSCSENKVLFLREKWVMRLQQDLADALRKNSLAEASLEAKKCYSRDLQEQKLRLQKELDRSKAKLQEVKERCICTECYAESLKNAIKEKELTTSRNVQAILAVPSAAVAIPELEEQVQQHQVVMTRLEATAQQQAKTTEALQKDQQASASRESEIEEVKNLAVMKCRTEALLKKTGRRNIAMEQERTRLKNLLESSDKAECYVRGKRQIPGRDEEYLF